jgi:hypothetical protein
MNNVKRRSGKPSDEASKESLKTLNISRSFRRMLRGGLS